MSTPRASSSTVTIPAPGVYRVDPKLSTIVVRTKHLFGLGDVRGTFTLRGGEIIVAQRVEDSHVEATAAAASFNSGNPGRDKRVGSKALLNAPEHPEFTFASHQMVKTGSSWTARGTLTARGKGAPCEFAVIDTVERPDGLEIVATGTVDRYAHGITGAKGFAGRYLDVTITVVVSTVA
jgi:polyisoprenoid-binding protein YceI